MSSFSLEKEIIFIHIPKNAGSSVRKALERGVSDVQDFHELDVSLRNSTGKERDPALTNHFPIYKIEELMKAKGQHLNLNKFTKFMVVRNPWERMVSLYFHRLRKLHMSVDGKPRNTAEDIEVAERGFIPWLLYTPNAGDKVLTRMSQCSWAMNEDKEFDIDVVLRFENLDIEWDVFSRRVLKIPTVQLPLMLKGTGHSNSYRKYYNRQASDHIEKYFAEDIERFKYIY